METVTDLIFLGFKITADDDFSHEIKRHLLLGKKAMTNLDSILKSRDITLPTKFHLVKAMIFPVVMYGCESWTIRRLSAKNWCFWTVVLEKTLESPLDYKEMKPVNPKENQSWMFTGRTDAEAEVPILWPPDAKSQLIGKDSDAAKTEGRRRRGWQRTRWLDGIPDSKDMSLSNVQEMLKDREARCAVVQGVSKSRTWLSYWTTSTTPCCYCGGEALLQVLGHQDPPLAHTWLYCFCKWVLLQLWAALQR